MYGHILWASSCINEGRTTSRIISRFDIEVASPCEDFEPWEVRSRFEVEPPRAWYYCIFPNFRTLVILLQVDLASGDESKIVYEGCYEIEDISIFAWFSILGIGHYRWLCGLIR